MKEFKEVLCRLFSVRTDELEITGHPIPCRIHRIWIGGGMPSHTFANLKDFQDQLKQRNSPYCHILWTDLQALKKNNLDDKQNVLNEQLKILRQLGMEIKDLAAFCPAFSLVKKEDTISRAKEMLAGYIKERAIAGYKAASDILRLLILYQEGGIYMDADIGIGFEQFNEPVYHRYLFRQKTGCYLPLIGSVSPFENLHDNSAFGPENYILTEMEAFTRKQAYGWNYFYASVAANPYVTELLETLLTRDAQTQSAKIADDLYRDLYGTPDAPDIMAFFRYAFAPLFLQYCTDASINKNGE